MNEFAMLAANPRYSATGPSLLLMMPMRVSTMPSCFFTLPSSAVFRSAWIRVLTLGSVPSRDVRVKRIYDGVGKHAWGQWIQAHHTYHLAHQRVHSQKGSRAPTFLRINRAEPTRSHFSKLSGEYQPGVEQGPNGAAPRIISKPRQTRMHPGRGANI